MRIDLPRCLRALASASSIDAVGSAVVSEIATARSVALVRAWAVGHSGALRLIGSAGTPSGGGSYNRLDGEFREMAVADALVASVASARTPMIVRGVRGDEDWLINPSWAARQGVRAFVALPLVDGDRCAGVIALFDRELPSEETLAQLELIADITAARLLALPSSRAAQSGASLAEASRSRDNQASRILTRAELRRVEKENIEAALAKSQGKIFGEGGAAALLGMRPTTLASRIKTLGILRPR